MGDDKITDLKKKAIAGTLWNLLSGLLTKFASMFVQLVLARLLVPEQFGTIALLNVFITISQVITTRGFATAIIQKKDLTETDKSSAHYMSICLSVIMYIVLFLIAPLAADFYDQSDLAAVLRVYSVIIVIGGFQSVHSSLIQKELRFQVTMWCGVITVVIQGTVGILLAYLDFGVWALVYSYIAGQLVSAVYTRLMVKWKPQWLFSWKSVKEMFKFSSNVLISSLFNTVYSDIRALIIGKVYTTETLAYYDRANLIRSYVFDTTIGAINTVMLPVLSKVNDDVIKVKQGLRRIIQCNMYISTPMRVGMILVAEPLILLLMTDRWAESVPFLQLICLTNLLNPNMNRTNAYLAIGRSDLALRTQIFNKAIILLGIITTMHISVYMVVVSATVGNMISFIMGLFVNKKYLKYTIREQMADYLPSLGLSGAMGIAVYLVSLLNIPTIPLLGLQVIVGGGIYLLLSVVFRYNTFYYLKDLCKEMLRKEKCRKRRMHNGDSI